MGYRSVIDGQQLCSQDGKTEGCSVLSSAAKLNSKQSLGKLVKTDIPRHQIRKLCEPWYCGTGQKFWRVCARQGLLLAVFLMLL